MKRKFKILILILILISVVYSFFKLIKFNTFKENILYSEKDVKEYSSDVKKDFKYLTREDAINKGLSIFEKGFKINLNRDNLNESIMLSDINNNPKWSITFMDKSNNEAYYCDILVNTGEILSASRNFTDNINYKHENLNKDNIIKVIKPLAKELNLNIDEKKLEFNFSGNNVVVVSLLNDKQIYRFGIDCENNKVIGFYKTNEK